MEKSFAIYGLIDPRCSKIFYIGKTARNPLVRLNEHLKDAEGMSPKQVRIREIYESMQGAPELVVLEDGISTEKSAFGREVFWIEMLSMVGADIANASIDYNGSFFLTEYHLNHQSVKDTQPQNQGGNALANDKSIYEIEIPTPGQSDTCSSSGLFDDGFFKVEKCSTFSPVKPGHRKSDIDFELKRQTNLSEGRLKNHGLPITLEEIGLLISGFQSGSSLGELEKRFQRSRRTIVHILEGNGYALESDSQFPDPSE